LAVCLFLLSASAIHAQQKPTEPRTKLETFQAKTGAVLIKNFSEIGSVYPGGVVYVTSYEFVDAQTGTKEYGIGIKVEEVGSLGRNDRAYVDYDEIDSLLAGIDYIMK